MTEERCKIIAGINTLTTVYATLKNWQPCGVGVTDEVLVELCKQIARMVDELKNWE